MIDRSRRGFTLIELMIVVAIIAILATITYPAYVDYVIRSNRSAAQQFILDIAQRQEQFLMDNRAYATTVAALGMTVPSQVDSKYTVVIDTNTTTTPPTNTPTYKIKATPIPGTIQVKDGELTMDQAGVKTPPDKWK